MQARTIGPVIALATVLAFGAGIPAAAASSGGLGATTADLASSVTAGDIQQPYAYDNGSTAVAVPDRSAASAINWYKSRNGSTAYEHYCEKAARLAWARSTHHASAIDHWRSSDGARHTTGTPPAGAFVFWNISSYGHVGVADGNGGFWATDVHGAIGHGTSVHYFSHYLGWKPGNSN